MTTGQGHTGISADGTGSGHDLGSHRSGQYIHRPAKNGDGHQRRTAHGVDIADGVGRGDTSEVIGIVDNRHEEIGGADDTAFVIETEYRSIVTAAVAHPELRERGCRLVTGEDFIQYLGGDLATAASPMAVLGQAHCIGHDCLR